jgi:integrase/recombinase XerD
MESGLLDAAGRRRSPATLPGHHRGRPPRNKGEQYPADPPTIEEIVEVMRTIGERPDGLRLRALIVLLWRSTHGSRSAAAPDRRDAVRDPRTDRRPALGGLSSTPSCRRRGGHQSRFAPHQLRHAHAVEMAHEGIPLVVIQRQLGHANLGITSVYVQGIDSSEIISAVHGRPSPTISATAGLQIKR